MLEVAPLDNAAFLLESVAAKRDHHAACSVRMGGTCQVSERVLLVKRG
jgi:hypothetical protein